MSYLPRWRNLGDLEYISKGEQIFVPLSLVLFSLGLCISLWLSNPRWPTSALGVVIYKMIINYLRSYFISYPLILTDMTITYWMTVLKYVQFSGKVNLYLLCYQQFGLFSLVVVSLISICSGQSQISAINFHLTSRHACRRHICPMNIYYTHVLGL
jgi:hypothetical protein